MKILCLVTARSGSKRFPGKNLAKLGGDPLVLRSWRTLNSFRERMTGPGHETILRLSTDSQAIANAWPAWDRPSDLRPAIISQDDTTSMDVVRYEMRRCPSDMVILLQPTSPLLTVEDVEAVFHSACSEPTIAIKQTQPSSWMKTMDEDWKLHGISAMSPTVYVPCGLYAAESKMLDKYLSFSVEEITAGIVIPPERAVDIDYPVDLGVAQWYLERERAQLDMMHLI